MRYTGLPSLKIDKSWDDLSSHLHCLNVIRRSVHPEYYLRLHTNANATHTINSPNHPQANHSKEREEEIDICISHI
ncbi:hypothetical protein L218DRAFT_349928 [Marasmius fiardii PR-910]|nr:hypothetical protein L218DRAFT_349928 [Marasmius fiardii PR-910]